MALLAANPFRCETCSVGSTEAVAKGVELGLDFGGREVAEATICHNCCPFGVARGTVKCSASLKVNGYVEFIGNYEAGEPHNRRSGAIKTKRALRDASRASVPAILTEFGIVAKQVHLGALARAVVSVPNGDQHIRLGQDATKNAHAAQVHQDLSGFNVSSLRGA